MATGGRRRSGLIFILIALFLLVILVVVTFVMRDTIFPFGKAQELPTPEPRHDLIDIIVLAQPVTRGTSLTEGTLAMISYPQSEMVEGLFYTDIQQVIDKRVKYDLAQGVPLTPSLLSEIYEGSYASFEIPRGMVAISIPITRLTSVSYALQPGDHVNIIGSFYLLDLDTEYQSRLPNWVAHIISPGPTSLQLCGGTCYEVGADLTLKLQPPSSELSFQGRAELDPVFQQPLYVIPQEPQRPRLVSQTLVQDAIVLRVGEFQLKEEEAVEDQYFEEGEPSEGEGEGEAKEENFTPPDIISLIVAPQDAVTLNYFTLTEANLTLVLRGAGDDQALATEAVTLQFIMDQYSIPYPAKLPYGIEQVKQELASPPGDIEEP